MKSFVAGLLLLPFVLNGGGRAAPGAAPGSGGAGLGSGQEVRNEPAYFKTGVLDSEARIWAQEQIERVFYNHRIWPKENPGPKPAFEAMVSGELIKSRANEALLKSAALKQYWVIEITPAMLQSEVERMGRETLAPETLNELFAALHDDPQLIAETLARADLSDRLLRDRFAYDTRFQGDALTRARLVRERAADMNDWITLGGQYSHTIIRKSADAGRLQAMEKPGEMAVEPARFELFAKRALPLGEISSLDELSDGFILHHTLSIKDNEIETEAIIIPKRNFDEWFAAVSPQLAGIAPSSAFSMQVAGILRLPTIVTTAGCDTWDDPMKINKMPEVRTLGQVAVWTGSEMIIWGGSNDDDPSGFKVLSSGGRYDPATDSWRSTSMGANLPAARISHYAVWTGNEMVVWGGSDNTGARLNSGGRYNPSIDSWRPTSTGVNVPFPRDASGSAVWTGSEMIIWGGYGAGVTYNSGGRYNPSADSWMPTSLGANVPSPRKIFSAVWTGSLMVVWGGCGSATGNVNSCSSVLNNGGRYDPTTDSWTPTALAGAPSARTAQATAWSGTEMIVWGGCTAFSPGCTAFTNSGGRYNPVSDSWTATSTGANVPTPRAPGNVAVWSGSEMIVWGGTGNQSGGRYNPGSDSWLPTSTGLGVPQHRSSYAAVWTGSEMIIWGGYDIFQSPTQFLNSGARYNPTADSWLATADVNVPHGRENHTATWTGNEMIIWGGTYTLPGNNIFYLSSGAKFNPATASWIPTQTVTNAPSPRSNQTAIWTGNEMIIWGGLINISPFYLNSGGRYNPTTDTWVATPISPNTPTARIGFTSVWSGSEMIVWGGIQYLISSSSYSDTNSGSRYSPVMDNWTPTLIDPNTPSARNYHTAIWSGNEMIIWGGGIATGSKYSPLSDSWSIISTDINAPSNASTAIWSGKEMILWGGYNGGYLNSGDRYNPSSNNWLATSTGANDPSGRNYQTTIWTGNELIIWGGVISSSTDTYLNSGGRYNPDSDSWLATSININTPSPRSRHIAAWTGSVMIIWGGDNNYHYYQGGIYASGSVGSPANSLRGTKSSYINLNWNTVYGAGSYNLKRCDPTATACIPGTIVSTPTINQYSELDDGLSHFYAVEAVNQCGATP